jgi:MFS transporter, DHA1 family, inner membrane transport protein
MGARAALSNERGRGEAHPATGGKLTIAALALAGFVAILSQGALGPFLALVADDLGTTVSLVGQVPAVSMLLAAALGLVVGPLADQYGQRRAVMVGLAAIALTAVGTSLATSYLALMVVTLVGAVGRASVLPVTLGLAGSRFAGEARRRALSWTTAGVSGAPIAGVPLLTAVAEWASWRAAFLALGVMTVVAAVLLWRALGPDGATPGGRPRASSFLAAYAPIARHRPTQLLLLHSMIGNAGLWCVYTYVGAYWMQAHDFTIQQVGLVSFIQGCGFLAGSLSMGSGPMGRIAPRTLLVGGRVGSGLLMTGVFLLPLPAPVGVLMLAVGGWLGALSTIATTLLLSSESPAGRATTMTLNGSAWSVGIAVGASLGGLVLALGGWVALGATGLFFFLAGAVFGWLSGTVARPAQARTPA